MEADLERIQKMEERLKENAEALRLLSCALDRLEDVRDSMISLTGYYGSEEWFEDREAALPEGMSAGVLSEDSVYDLITDMRGEAFRMIETATDILKNRI